MVGLSTGDIDGYLWWCWGGITRRSGRCDGCHLCWAHVTGPCSGCRVVALLSALAAGGFFVRGVWVDGADGGGEVAAAGSGVVLGERGEDWILWQVEFVREVGVEECGEAIEGDGVELAGLLVEPVCPLEEGVEGGGGLVVPDEMESGGEAAAIGDQVPGAGEAA